jgi:hypothetical protein
VVVTVMLWATVAGFDCGGVESGGGVGRGCGVCWACRITAVLRQRRARRLGIFREAVT